MTDILIADFVKGLLIFLRISGILVASPVFNVRQIPYLSKIFLAVFITYLVFFFVPDVDASAYDNVVMLGLIGVKEILTGLIIGFAMNFIFYGISFAGLLLGYEMGLMIAQMFDPTTESTNNIIGQTLLIAGLLVFILINGPHFVVHAISYSFEIIPLGFYTINENMFDLLLKYSSGIWMLAVKIASPILVSFFLLDLGAGIIARVIPQMNVFFVVAPLKIALGLGLLIVILPIYVYIIKNLLESYENKLLTLVQAMSQ